MIDKDVEAFVTQSIARFVASQNQWKMSAKELLYMWAHKYRWVETEGGIVLDAPPECTERMCGLCMYLPELRPFMKRVLSIKLEADFPLTKEERRLAGVMLRDGLPGKQIVRPGKKPSENLERNVFIVLLARNLNSWIGVDFIRNDEPKTQRVSAADLISAGFVAANRHEVTYRAVKEVLCDAKLRRYVDLLSRQIRDAKAFHDNHNHLNALAPRPSAVPEIF